MEITNLTFEERVIVKDLCRHQFKSLKRLYYGSCDKSILEYAKANCIAYEVSEEEYKKNLIKRARVYQAIQNDPDRVKELSVNEMSIIKTILFNFEEEYKTYHPGIVEDLWAKFDFYDKLKDYGPE